MLVWGIQHSDLIFVYNPYKGIIKYWLNSCAVYHIIVTFYFVPSSLYCLIPFTFLATPLPLSLLVITSLFSVC